MAFLGSVVTYYFRKDDSLKHTLGVFDRWLIRLAGVIVIYNSTASPMVACVFFAGLVLVYVMRAALKSLGRTLFGKSKSA